MTLAALVDRAAERWPEREALVFGEQRWTFSRLREDIARAERALIALGVAPGDRVAIWLDNRPEWLHVFLATAAIGAIAVPVNSRFRAVDLEYVLRQSDASVLVLADRSGPVDYLGILREIVPEIDRPTGRGGTRQADAPRVVVLGETIPPGTVAWRTLVDRARPGAAAVHDLVHGRERAVTPDDVTLMLYTSGTTGTPKGALHTHAMIRTVSDGASRLGITPRDRLLLFLPLFHSMGLYTGPLLSLVSGAPLILMERFDAGAALALIATERITFFAGFDTHASDLLAHPSFGVSDLGSVRVVFVPAGAPSVEPVARRLNRRGIATVSGYGSTEVGTGICYSFLDASEDERATGSGFPMPGYELRVVDPESGAMRRPGVPGELWVRGYGVTRGYHGKPDETAAALDADGWFHTGDLAVLDADGYLRFLGRLKDMLKVGGENVDPAELEAFLLGYAPVAQVKVVGIPDARLGEVAVACVVLRPGSSATEDDVIAFCRGRIASFKIPRRVLFVTGYPLTSTGKVQRFALRDRVSAMLEAEGTMANETHDEARLHAPVGFGPDVEAELVLSRDTFSIRYDMDRETGVISRHGHALEGMSLAGKIVYFPAVQGGVAAGWAFLALTGRGVAPAGVLFGRTNPVMIQGLVLAGIPVMHRVSPDPFTVFRTGDRVRMSPSRGLVERAARTGC